MSSLSVSRFHTGWTCLETTVTSWEAMAAASTSAFRGRRSSEIAAALEAGAFSAPSQPSCPLEPPYQQGPEVSS